MNTDLELLARQLGNALANQLITHKVEIKIKDEQKGVKNV
jgi:hypothetical protein